MDSMSSKNRGFTIVHFIIVVVVVVLVFLGIGFGYDHYVKNIKIIIKGNWISAPMTVKSGKDNAQNFLFGMTTQKGTNGKPVALTGRALTFTVKPDARSKIIRMNDAAGVTDFSIGVNTTPATTDFSGKASVLIEVDGDKNAINATVQDGTSGKTDVHIFKAVR